MWQHLSAMKLEAAGAIGSVGSGRAPRVPSAAEPELQGALPDWPSLATLLQRSATLLLRLQGVHRQVGAADLEAHRETLLRLVGHGWEVAAPVEILLTTGGDTRLRIDAASALNQY